MVREWVDIIIMNRWACLPGKVVQNGSWVFTNELAVLSSLLIPA